MWRAGGPCGWARAAYAVGERGIGWPFRRRGRIGPGGGAEEPDRGDQRFGLVRAQRPVSQEVVQGLRFASGVDLVGGAGLPFLGFGDEVAEESLGRLVFEEGFVLLVVVAVLGRDLIGVTGVDQQQPEGLTQIFVEAECVGVSERVGEADERPAGLVAGKETSPVQDRC